MSCKLNMKHEDYFKGKKITLMGLGLLGRGVGDARFMAEQGAILTVTDLKTEEELKTSIEALADFPDITFVLGEHRTEDFVNADMIMKSAGVPLDNEHIASAQSAGVPVKMSASLFAELSPATIVGITGTRGKSTVTHLVAETLGKTGKKVFAGGNVRGVSTLAHLPESTEDEIAVLELDSWQLQGFGDAKMSPHISVFTTFMRDHMNYYNNDEGVYLRDKANIFLYQNEDDHFVLGPQARDLILAKYKEEIKGELHEVDVSSVNDDDCPALKGEHNKDNIALAKEVLQILDLSEEEIQGGIKTFRGVLGRLQDMGEVRGVQIYNDNNATTPDAAIAGLKAVGKEKKTVLIMGGADKGLDMSPLLDLIPTYCKWVVLLPGTGTDKVRDNLKEKGIEIRDVKTMQDAVCDAADLADEGDVVLFSPAFASFGLFINEYDRGDQFMDMVERL